ncbi:iron-sulfur cluster repair di-iron protein [Granulicoccus sp. GXG6511]|uniref:iron-sulfur cluster repair di-iron protein n=1 Tax=Granulicoccus sp. GXG6511 TaxID=3381351 RepID=UPI003D7DED1D
MSAELSTATLVGDFVAVNPGTARVLEAHGLDYCCGGQRPLAAAAAESGLDAEAILAELTAVAPATDELDVTKLTNAELCDHLVSTHHEYLWREMPRVTQLANKVARVHGANHPELREVQLTWQALVTDLTEHLMTEEQEEFPAIKQAEADGNSFSREGVEKLMGEHDEAGELLARLRELTGGFEVPADGCGSYRALYAGLEDAERDLHTHIHKENNILFPRLR